jgi:hypothetical protein
MSAGPVPVVTLLTDFGTEDYYVGAVKGTLLRLAGTRLQLVDLSHEVPAGDVVTGAFVLGAAWQTFPEGTVHLAVVDPGVGSGRRILAARRDGHCFVAPDNGLLHAIMDDAEVVHVRRDDLFLPAPGATFHGRDRFAPVAASLARGDTFEDLGDRIDDPIRLDRESPRREADTLVGYVVHVDRFGNLVTDIPAEWLQRHHGVMVWVGTHSTDRVVDHYAVLPPGKAGLLVGSLGTLELSLPGESLATTWSVTVGDRVEVRLDAR